jgi:hypothetical protein
MYVAIGQTQGVRNDVLETPNEAEALFHMLHCWLALGCREISLKREWRVLENAQAQAPDK